MKTLIAGIAECRTRAGSVRMIDVAVVGPDGVERYVREPVFENSSPDNGGVTYDEFHGLMREAGFNPSIRSSDVEVLGASDERCECGGALDARGYRREDPLCYRAFAVCAACGRVAFEY